MECPKCGLIQDQSSECSGCGIIIAKYLARQDAPVKSPARARGRRPRYRLLEIDKELRNYYHSQSLLLGAGLSAAEAIKNFITNSEVRDVTPYQRIERVVADGGSVSQGMTKSDDYFPAFHTRLVEAGEKSGNPEQMFRELLDIVEWKLQTIAVIASELRWPAFTLMGSVFILPLPVLVSDGLPAYLNSSLVPALLVVAALYFLYRLSVFLARSEEIALAVHRKLLDFPLYDIFQTNQFLKVFHTLYCAGVDNASAFAMATSVLGNKFLVKVLSSFQPYLDRGDSLSSIIKETGAFSPDLIQFVSTGEVSGTLDASLRKYLEISEDTFKHRLSRFSRTFAAMTYTLIMLYAGYQIIQGFTKVLG